MASDVASEQDNLRTDYEQTNEQIRMLTDIRFRLLALIPSGTVVAVSVLGTAVSMETALVVGILGFVIVFAIIMYDLRNSQIYDACLGRARQLEKQLQMLNGGLYSNRPNRDIKLFNVLLVWHDRALAFIYGTTLGGWFYLIIYSLLNLLLSKVNIVFYLVSILISSLVACAFIWHFHQIEATRSGKKKGFPKSENVQQVKYFRKNIVLIRHGDKSLPGPQDKDRPLSKEGKDKIHHLKNLLTGLNLNPEICFTSSHKHAKETADLLADKKPDVVHSISVLTPPVTTTGEKIFQTIVDQAKEQVEPDQKTTIAIVGHYPSLGQILKSLTSDNVQSIWLEPGEAVWLTAASFSDFLSRKGVVQGQIHLDKGLGRYIEREDLVNDSLQQMEEEP